MNCKQLYKRGVTMETMLYTVIIEGTLFTEFCVLDVVEANSKQDAIDLVHSYYPKEQYTVRIKSVEKKKGVASY